MHHIATIILLALTLSTVACGAADGEADEPETTTAAEHTAAADQTSTAALDPVAACIDAFTRARTCTDDYIPALVALRVSLDIPAGIAQVDQDEGRAALVAVARKEWQGDSEPAAIAARCQQMANIPAAQALAQSSAACTAMASCGEFTDCVMPLHQAQFTAAMP
ncbi:MAG: hypothetical protein AAGC55_02590 [Myxococcota bacterium]